MSSDIAIKVENLSKCYQIYDTPRDRLKQFIYPKIKGALAPIARLLGSHLPLATRLLPRNYYKEFWALKDVSFEVKKGETVGIIGRNGSGKSTLLQMICGTLTPTSGSVQTNGRIAALLELGSGFNPEFTGRENVYMNASILGLSQDEIDARFDDIAAFADIGEFIEQPVKTYSSGMMVRLAFAVIAHVDADILVIDEALAVGDAFFTQKCMRFLRKFQEDGAILFVSHDTAAVVGLCHWSHWLHQGTIRRSGKPKEVSEAYLAAYYEAQQGTSIVTNAKLERLQETSSEPRDMRLDFINTTPLRNDIELFEFSESGLSFGKGGAIINSVFLVDRDGKPLSWVVGGEFVTLVIKCCVQEELNYPIIGFTVKDRLGQSIFAENTFLSYCENPISVLPDQILEAQFSFRMPVMPVGDYSISIAVAEGTQQEHVQHQWVNDALIFKVHSSSVCHGLIGVPMQAIRMSVI